MLETVGIARFSSMESEFIPHQRDLWETTPRVQRSLALRYGYVVAHVGDSRGKESIREGKTRIRGRRPLVYKAVSRGGQGR